MISVLFCIHIGMYYPELGVYHVIVFITIVFNKMWHKHKIVEGVHVEKYSNDSKHIC